MGSSPAVCTLARTIRGPVFLLALIAACLTLGCDRGDRTAGTAARAGAARVTASLDTTATLTVLHAGSLARPLRAALDSFTARRGVRVATVSAGSLEAARRITELHDVPDVIALADEEVFPSLLMPHDVSGYFIFARNRLVIAVAPTRAGVKIDSTNWYHILAAPDVEVGRSDPNLDPAGYRALLMLQLAERAYQLPSIGHDVLARSPMRNVRPKSADLIALLETGALDYAFVYQSSARSAKLRWIALPSSIDLGDDTMASDYARVSVRVTGRSRGDSISVRGAPIRYALAVPIAAPHRDGASSLAMFLLSPVGLRAMRAGGLDVVPPRFVGEHPPAWFTAPRAP